MTSYEELETIEMCVGFLLKFSNKMLIRTMNGTLTHNGWVYEKVFYLKISKFIPTFVKNFLIHLVMPSLRFSRWGV